MPTPFLAPGNRISVPAGADLTRGNAYHCLIIRVAVRADGAGQGMAHLWVEMTHADGKPPSSKQSGLPLGTHYVIVDPLLVRTKETPS